MALMCFQFPAVSTYELVVRWNLPPRPRGDRGELMSAARVAALLMKHKATVAVAESSAGGAISRSLVAVRGASNYFAGSAVCYTAASKHTLLGLTPAHLW